MKKYVEEAEFEVLGDRCTKVTGVPAQARTSYASKSFPMKGLRIYLYDGLEPTAELLGLIAETGAQPLAKKPSPAKKAFMTVDTAISIKKPLVLFDQSVTDKSDPRHDYLTKVQSIPVRSFYNLIASLTKL